MPRKAKRSPEPASARPTRAIVGGAGNGRCRSMRRRRFRPGAPTSSTAPAADWTAMLALARRGEVHCPLRAPHSLMSFYTLAANLGHPCAIEGPALIDETTGAAIYECLRELVALIDPACFAMDPIAVFEAMARSDSKIACVPLIYGYVNYALEGFRPKRLRFADIPAAGALGPIGSALGGTGIALSAQSAAQARRPSPSPIGSPAQRRRAAPTPRPAANPAMPRRGIARSQRASRRFLSRDPRDAGGRLAAPAPFRLYGVPARRSRAAQRGAQGRRSRQDACCARSTRCSRKASRGA